MMYSRHEAHKALRKVNYLRYSDHKQDGGTSIETQKDHCDKYGDEKGMIHVADYIDEAKSASKGVAGREDFLRVLEDAKRGLFDIVLIFKFSRVFRNQYEAHFYEHELAKHGVKLISVTEPIADTDEGHLMKGIIHAFNEFTARTISAHVASGMNTLAKKGYFLNSVPLFGFDAVHDGIEGKRYVPNPEESKIVRELFELFAEGLTVADICRVFTDKGYKTRQYKKRGGNYFGETTLRSMLANVHYIGTYYYHSSKGYEDVVIEDNHPAIIDKATFFEVQARLKAQEEKAPKPRSNARRTYYLSGKTYCAYCEDARCTGSTGRWTTKGKTYCRPYYQCQNRRQKRGNCPARTIRKDDLERYVFGKIREHILNEDAIKIIAQNAYEITGDTIPVADIERLHNRQSEIMERLSAAMDATTNMKLPEVARKMWQSKVEDISKELEDAALDLRRAEHAADNSLTVEKIEAYLTGLLDSLDKNNDSPELLKAIVDKFVDKVVISNDDVQLYLHVLSSDLPAYRVNTGLPVFTQYARINKGELNK